MSRLLSGISFPSFSPVSLKTFFRFSGLLRCAVYQGDLTGLDLITDADDELTHCGGMFDVVYFGNF